MNLQQVATEACDAAGRAGQQRVAELTAVLEFLAPRKPQRIVEIGVHDGGTLWAWRQLAPHVIGIDMTDTFIQPRNVGRTAIVIGDSTNPGTVEDVADRLTGPIDFLFIDGNHSREGVVADYETWLPFMAADGVIGFHDIAVACEHGWREVLTMQTDALSIEFVRRDDSIMRMGIGLLVLGTERGDV